MRVGIVLRKNLGTMFIVISLWVLMYMFVSWVVWQQDDSLAAGNEALPRRLLFAAIAGLVLGLFNTAIELFVLRRQLRKWPFLLVIGIRTLMLLLFLSLAAGLGYLLYTVSVLEYLSVSGLSAFLEQEYGENGIIVSGFTIMVSIITNFVWQISRTLSPERFYNYMTGKYHRPREEFRVVMFLDVKSSTRIAEQLGNLKYHEFLNEFFYDLDEEIARHEGEIYQYVGDEVIIVWRKEFARYKGYAIRSYFRCRKRIQKLSHKYREKYGFVPEFRASLHCGNVVVGEVGDTKKEIVFHGDVINTGSRILDQCKPLQYDFLVSKDVLDSFGRAKGTGIRWDKYRLEDLGAIKLRGKETEIEIYGVEEL